MPIRSNEFVKLPQGLKVAFGLALKPGTLYDRIYEKEEVMGAWTWPWLVLLLASIVIQIITMRRLSRVEDKLRHNNMLIEGLRTHQSSIARSKTSTASPTVDSRARTTRRDTADLPATGRMSQGVHRIRSNGGRIDSDSQL